jgi:DNA-binding response OmpR family regulator
MTRILLIEDDQNLSDSISSYLTQDGFEVLVASSITQARQRLKDAPELLVLDWMLPDGQGIDYLKELQKSGNNIPVILLTARADLIDKVLGLETGASDYITKPFAPRELCARIRVQLRKQNSSAQTKEEPMTYGDIRLDPTSREVTYKGRLLQLTRMEFELLRVLLQSPQRVFPREALLNKVWGYENYPTTRTVDNHVAQLRQKLGEEWIETVRGVGYRLVRPEIND